MIGFLRRLCSLPAVLFLVLAAGCTSVKDRDLLETIPSDTGFAGVVDLGQWMKAAGCQAKNGSFTLSEPLEELLSGISPNALDVVSEIVMQGERCRLDRVAFFTDNDTRYVTLMRVPDTEFSLSAVSLSASSDKAGDISVYRYGDLAVAVSPVQIWVTRYDEKIADRLDDIITRADSGSLASSGYLDDFLASDHPAKAIVRIPELNNPAGESFTSILCCGDLADRKVSVSASYIDAAGRKVSPFSRLIDIDDDFAGILPQNTAITAGIGITSDFVDSLIQTLSSVLPLQYRMSLKLISRNFDYRSGTFAMALAPGGSAETIADISADTWQMLALIPRQDSTPEGSLSLMAKPMERFADKVDRTGEGFVAHIGGLELYFTEYGKYLALSNYAPGYYKGGETPVAVAGKRFAVNVSIPYRSELMKAWGLPQGLELRIACSDSTTDVDIAISGDASYILPVMIEFINVLRNEN